MQHSYIDRYGDIESFIHGLDPRIKIISVISLILSIIFTSPTSFSSFALYALLIATLILLSKIPAGFILKRSFVVVPFVLMVALFIPFFKEGEVAGGYSFGSFRVTVTYSGLMVFWNVLVKAYLSILCMILLMASTKFSALLKALEKLRLPKLFIMILSFMYRYIFVVVDELMKMKQAKESRSVGGSRRFHIKALTNMIGVLFIRSYERAELVYMAMCSRGFNGTTSTIYNFRIGKKDIGFISALTTILILIKSVVS